MSKVTSRKAFSGALVPSTSRAMPVRHQRRTVIPQALFTKNKTKNEVCMRCMIAELHRSDRCRLAASQLVITHAYFLLQKKSRTDKSAKEVDPTVPAFTRRREVFAGRLAMFGFAASLIGEVGRLFISATRVVLMRQGSLEPAEQAEHHCPIRHS